MISEVFENQTLYLKNVLYYRGWVTQQDSNKIFQKMESFFTSANAQKDGNIVTVTNAVETKDGAPMMDIEIFIPLDKEIKVNEEYKFIPAFEITNALMIRIEGHPTQWQTAMQNLSEHIQKNDLQPTTPALMATVKAVITPLEIDEMITEIYVGIKGE